MTTLNETHDARLTSWVRSAQAPGSDFPIQNLPHAVFRRTGGADGWRGGVAIGDQVLDMAAAATHPAFKGDAEMAAREAGRSELNGLMALGPKHWAALRLALSRALREGSAHQASLKGLLIAQADVEYTVPARVGDYTDFYASVYHATNIGRLFRPDSPLMPNFKWLPVAYHGRASSIGVSGQRFARPRGQVLPAGASEPVYSECKRLDYELELGVWVGPGNAQGEPIALRDADNHLFGMCLLNDWSARDIQAWEYQPLGPFLAKNFATTISPWIVTLEALAPYRCAWSKPAEDPKTMAYLDDERNRREGGLDIQIEAWLESETMRQRNQAASRLSHTSFRHSYWNIAQMLAHHTVGGCNMMPGDLYGTGTQSGPTRSEAGALIELTTGGKEPVTLTNGETRAFLADGDVVILKAWCEKDGCARIGFGESRGQVLPAR